jgi:hypothetical protein
VPESAGPSPVEARIAAWRAARNTVALGNAAEQVASRLLARLGYEVLATQRDLDGGVANIVGHATRSNPEDFIVVTPDGRLATVNSKATWARSPSGRRADGNLIAPRMPRQQRTVEYSTMRAGLLSPLEGDSYALILKVDLTHRLAQVFEVDETGVLIAVGEPVSVAGDLVEVLDAYPRSMPAPIGPQSSEMET